jgi:histidinol-phosphate aminotransferase
MVLIKEATMSDFSQLVPEHVRRLGGYVAGKSLRQAQQESRVTCIKMASNESPFGPSPVAIRAMQSVLAETNFYPDNDASELRQKIAEREQVKPEQIVVTAGSTSLLDIIARTLLSPGFNAVTSERSFIVYPIATKAAGGELIEVPMREHGFDLDAVATAVNPKTRVVFVANPNNPTGTLVSSAELDRFLEKMPEHVIVVLDEAYYDYARHFTAIRGGDYSRSMEYVREGRNVVVLRTFSKAHGLAGLRIGYGIGPAELISYFARMRTTFSISVPAQAAALAAFEDVAHTTKAVTNNAEQAQPLSDAIQEMGYTVVPTWANFIYCETGDNASDVAKRLQAEGVIIRPMGPWGAPEAIRITVGTAEQNAIFLRAFRKVMAKAALR